MERFKLTAVLFGVMIGIFGCAILILKAISLYPELFWVYLLLAVFAFCYWMAGDILTGRGGE